MSENPAAGERTAGEPRGDFREMPGRRGAKLLNISTTLADLLTALLAANPFSAMRASLWR
jgi:hypothetical protein